MLTIPRETCIDLERAFTHEWLVTNGRGSYASSTIVGANTRRYHGLLVAALNPPLGRTVMVAKVEEEIDVAGKKFLLGVNEWENRIVNPNGHLHLDHFELDEMIPAWLYQTASFDLRKTIWMEYGFHTTYVRYTLSQRSEPVALTLLPYCTYRDFHTELRGQLDSPLDVELVDHGCRIRATPDATPYRIMLDRAASFVPLGIWYWRLLHRVEAERGLDAVEDLYVPGQFRLTLNPGESVTLILTTEPDQVIDRDAPASLERARTRELELAPPAADEFERQLTLAADQFIVTRDVGTGNTINTVLAGYHWFGDWGGIP